MTRRSLLALTFGPFLGQGQTPPTLAGELTELRNRLFAIEERLGALEHLREPWYPRSQEGLKT